MKTNYVIDSENKETVNAISKAVEWEKYDMLLSLNGEAQKKQQSIIDNENSTLEEKTAARTKLEKLQEEETKLEESQKECDEMYNTVLNAVTGAKTEYATNDKNAFRNILRLSSCDENSKFFKLAILADESIQFGEFYNAMVEFHDMENAKLESSGLRNYTKEQKEKADALKGNIQDLLKKCFFVPVENEYTKKISVKFNRTDMYAIHETFVTGLTVDMKKKKQKNSDKSETVVNGMLFQYAIKKTQKQDGTTTYTGTRFKETLAKIAFTKLFSSKATTGQKRTNEKVKKPLMMTVANGVSKSEEESAKEDTTMIYNLISAKTREMIAYTIISLVDSDCDISDEELLEARLESAITDEVIPDDSYEWVKNQEKIGVLI